MQMLLILIVVGYLLYFLFKSVKSSSYRHGYQDGQKQRNREGSIDVEYKVIEDEEKKQ